MWKHFASGAPAAFVVLLSSVGRQQPANLPSTVTTVGPGSCVADCHCPPVITCTAELVALSSAESAGQFWFNCALVACVLNLFCLAVGKWAYPFTVAGIGASWSVSLPGLPPAVSAASSVDLLDFDSAVVASPLALELPARVKFAAAAKAVGYYAVVTPDGDMYIEPLNHVHNDVADIRVLQQQGHLPPGLLEADMYRFGAAPVGAVLAQFMRDGAFLAAGHAGPPAAAAAVPPPGGPGPVAAGGIVPAVPMFWVAAENLLGLRVGDSVEPLPAGTFTVGNKGILARGGGHLFIKAVPAGHVEAPEDLTVLPVVFDNQDLRFRDFGGALAAMDTAEPEGGIMLSGPRTCMWMLKNMRDSGGNPSSHHDRWVRSSKVADSDRSVYEHEILCRILESMICTDQLNVPALQSAEILSRRIQLIKEAHRVNPSAPDYSAGDHFLGTGVRRNGAAIAPDLSKFVAEELRAEAAISKEARKAREEKGLKPRGGRGGRGGRLGKGGAAADAAGFRSEGMKRRAGRRTPSSSQMYSPREAIRELLGSSYGYSEVSTTVRPFDPVLVSIPSVGTRAPSIMSVLDPVGVDVVADYEHSMLLSSNEYGSVLEEGIKVQPYMDVILQSSISSYQAFVHSLFTRGMLDFCEHAGGLVTPFFVTEKGGKLRLIFDCRTVNLRFKKAPKIAMGSGSSWASLEVAEGEQLWIAQSDIKDYFYSLALPAALAQFFCLPSIDASLLTEWGVPGALGGFSNYQGRCYPRLRVVPMGWSWAMWIAQRAHQFQALIGAGLNQDRLLVDGRPAPNLKDGTPIILPYCDNLNIAGTNRELVQQAKEGAVKRLREVGFLVREEVEACLQVDSLGYTINGSTGIVAPQPLKAERLVKGFIYISRRPIMTGRQLEHVMGHCIHQMLLKRELLCIFRTFYDFISQCYDTPVVVWPSVVKEARWAATLLRLCHSNLRRPWDLLVTASNASLTGIAVTSARRELPDVVAVGAMNERWRYRGKHPSDKPRQSALGLLDPLLDVESVKPEADIQRDNYELNPNFKEVPERLLLPEDWKLRYSARMHDKENIMILEGRGVEASLRRRLRAQLSFGKRCLNLGDNLGLTLGFCKGRFTSYPLLRIARRVTALTVAGDLSPAHRWHPSERNTADAGSRKWEPPGLQKKSSPASSSTRSKRKTFGGASQEERVNKRLPLGKNGVNASLGMETLLEVSAVMPCTNLDYDRRLGEFTTFISERGLSLKNQPSTDAAMVDFLHLLWEEGRELNEGLRFYAAFVAKHPEFGRSGHLRLPRTKRALTGWRKLAPCTTRPPMPWEVACLIASHMIQLGFVTSALILVLLFTLYGRPTEILELRQKDLIKPRSAGGFFTVHLHPEEALIASKVGLYEESLMLDSPLCRWLGPLLMKLVAAPDCQEHLFPIEYHTWKLHWDAAIKAADLQELGYVPYQLRHGGPSHDHFFKLRSMLEIKLRGRWASDVTLKRYEAGGRIEQELQRLGSVRLKAAKLAAQTLEVKLSVACNHNLIARQKPSGASKQPRGLRAKVAARDGGGRAVSSSSSSQAQAISQKLLQKQGWTPRAGT
ncbi:unnamed protein product [Polarella glacialis]|uniref:Uncharacterized protein n=1 Tax=Polarella glacialis TaxID=89957 RepID=A0A813D9F2_POLGL|nr:unnamed protein product [Polarella glacialis]